MIFLDKSTVTKAADQSLRDEMTPAVKDCLDRNLARQVSIGPVIEHEPVVPVSEVGDVWILGSSRLVCGDCTDVLVVEKALNGVKPGRRGRTRSNDHLTSRLRRAYN